jgi:hypothetical protein
MAKGKKTPADGGRALPPARQPSRANSPSSDKGDATPFVLTLRDVEVPPPPGKPDKPVGDGLVVSDRGFDAGLFSDPLAPTIEAAPPSAPAPPTAASLVMSDPEPRPEPDPGDPDADRAAQRAARRAQVRRDRVRDTASETAGTPPAHEGVPDKPATPQVLVLSADDDAGGELCGLLRVFGFDVQQMAAPPTLPAPWPFVAVFVTSPMRSVDGGDAIDLCNHVRETSRLPGEKKPVLVLAALQLTATDRVRAGLAGCNEILLGSPTRGAVAQLLDARGIALPSDARRG